MPPRARLPHDGSGGIVGLLDLPEELRVAIAYEVVLGGEAYWLASTCSTCRDLVNSVCARNHLGGPVSHLGSAFVSLKRLRAASRIEGFCSVAVANPHATSVEHRPATLDGHYRWSCHAERAMVARAPREVLDYAWGHWKRSLNPIHPACALRTVCACGRTDLLDCMYAFEDTTGLGSLSAVLRLTMEGMPHERAAIQRAVKMAMIMPLVRGASRTTLDWYYGHMEALEESLGLDASEWRRQFQDVGAVHELAMEAIKGTVPHRALDLLVDCVWPRLGDRSPLARQNAELAVCGCVVACMRDEAGVPVNVWQWLHSRTAPCVHPDGLLDVLRSLYANTELLPRHWNTTKMHAACLQIKSVGVYKWMCANVDYMHAALFPGEIEWWPPNVLGNRRYDVTDHENPVWVALAHLAVGSACSKDTKSEPARQLAAAALADLLVWDDCGVDHKGPRRAEVMETAKRVLSWSVHALSDALVDFGRRTTDTEWHTWVLQQLMEPLLSKLSSEASLSDDPPPSLELDSSDEDVVRSISCLREVCSRWQHERGGSGGGGGAG